MLLQASLHAIDGAPTDLQAPMNGGRVEARLQKFFDVLLDLRRLLASAWHRSASHAQDAWGLCNGVPVV